MWTLNSRIWIESFMWSCEDYHYIIMCFVCRCCVLFLSFHGWSRFVLMFPLLSWDVIQICSGCLKTVVSGRVSAEPAKRTEEVAESSARRHTKGSTEDENNAWEGSLAPPAHTISFASPKPLNFASPRSLSELFRGHSWLPLAASHWKRSPWPSGVDSGQISGQIRVLDFVFAICDVAWAMWRPFLVREL